MVCKDLGVHFISSSDISSKNTFSISERITIGVTTIIHKCMYIIVFIFFFISFTLKIKTRSFWVHDNFYVSLSIETAVVGFAYWLLVRSIFLPHVPRYILLSYTQTTSCYGFIYFLIFSQYFPSHQLCLPCVYAQFAQICSLVCSIIFFSFLNLYDSVFIYFHTHYFLDSTFSFQYLQQYLLISCSIR